MDYKLAILCQMEEFNKLRPGRIQIIYMEEITATLATTSDISTKELQLLHLINLIKTLGFHGATLGVTQTFKLKAPGATSEPTYLRITMVVFSLPARWIQIPILP